MREITEKLANLSIPQVLIIVAILAALRLLLPRLKNPSAKSIAEICESLAIAMALVFLLIRPFLVQAFYIPSPSMNPTLLENDQILVNKFIYRVREPKLGDVVVFKAPPTATPDIVSNAEAEASERGLQGSEFSDFVNQRVKATEKDFIKRVIGVPGDIVRITGGYVLINNVQRNRNELRGLLSQYMQSGGTDRIRLMKDYILVGDRKVTKAEIAAAVNDPKAKIKIFPGTVYINNKPLVEPYINEDPDLPYPILDGDETKATRDTKDIVDVKGKLSVKIPKGKLLVMGDNRNNSFDARFWGLLDRDRVLGKAMFIFWPITRARIIH